MKMLCVKLLLITALFLSIFTLFSCKRLPNPEFSYFPEENTEAGDTIWFLNESSRAESFQWEFGDGKSSRYENPTHVYEKAGIFEVKLNAYNESGKDYWSLPITINEPTILSFISIDSLGNIPLPWTKVWVYDNQKDRDSLYAPLLAGITDKGGNLEFRNVDPLIYHVLAFKEESGGRWEYRGYTSNLLAGKVNRYIIPCYWISNEQATGQKPGGPNQLQYRPPI